MQEPSKTIPSRCSTEGANPPSPSERGLGGEVSKTIDFDKCLTHLTTKGQQQFGAHFKVHPADYEIIYKLLVYALKDTPSALRYKINLTKGILLTGPVGCGKTTLMTLLNHFIQPEQRHIMKPCRDVSYEFIKEGYETITKYSHHSYNKNRNETWPRVYCFDDLGTENNLKYYGNECNVMAEVLLTRYDHFVQNRMLTHITTNLSASEIESTYGNRLRSRMREQFNLISFDQTAPDKRS